ncbi:MAG: COX15/CtaA family protein [Rickettsiales bacterium]|nr:COX15/CtaA family protein [Rickettsiales bacterium]
MNISITARLYKSWVLTCLLLVFCMIVIGGLTRLTESGLSIVQWKLLSGVLPPLSTEAWDAEFAAYQTTPEYALENATMKLADFKGIFWLEYLHRLLGRLIGLCTLIPLGFLLMQRHSPRWLRVRMTVITLLIGMQGTVGWYMVKSGLIDVPWVSPYRLALHLSLAVTIFGLLLVTLLRLSAAAAPSSKAIAAQLRPFCRLSLAVLFIQIILGAFVAGLDAGFTYNTFPLMDGDFVPETLWQLSPWPRNLFENIATVQFLHRWWAFVVTAILLLTAWRIFILPTSREQRCLAIAMVCTVALQVALGIATLIMVVPTGLATLHQAMAVVLFAWVVWLNYRVHPLIDAAQEFAGGHPSNQRPLIV